METIVEVKNLSKSYGKQKVLDDISFQIKEKEIVGFIGPNGAGKSTLMKCMCNLIQMDEGYVSICGKDVKKEREEALSLQASLIESPGLYMSMSGRQNLNLFASLKGVDKQRREEMAEYTKIGKQLNKKVGDYSLGMKQRLALAIALLSKPKFLMLDEPMNGLDPTGVHELREELRNMVERDGMSLLISSHQLNEIEKIADRIIYIDHGKIKELEKNEIVLLYQIKVDKEIEIAEFPYKLEKQDEGIYQCILKDEKEFSDLMKSLMENDIKILDVTKVVKDLEEIYSSIYEARS